jgi:hypothetical protein
MLRKTKEDLKELFGNAFEVAKCGTVEARPTAPGEAVVCDNFNGQVQFTNFGYIVTKDKIRKYYEPSQFHSMYEEVPNAPEGPGNSRTYRYKGRFKAVLYSGDPFTYRASEGHLEVVKHDSYIVEIFDDFEFVEEAQFRKAYRNV